MTAILDQLMEPGRGLTVLAAESRTGVCMTASPAGIRRDYTEHGPLLESALAGDWTAQFTAWFADAAAFGLPEPNAMILATADGEARPSARTVLLKGYDQQGFVFFTNYESQKGSELARNPQASLV